MAAAGLMVVTACGGSGDNEAADGELTAAEAIEASPLAQALGFSTANEADFEQASIERERRHQELVAECMRAQGFEYTPVDPSTYLGFEEPGNDSGLEEGSRQWVERYGFGMSTTFDEDQDFVAEEAFEDPNQEYLDSLSESEREAYYAALVGEAPEFDPTLAEDEQPSFEGPGGCEGQAFEEAGGFAFDSEELVEFDQLQRDLYQRIEADPRIVELDRAWTECMADAGYPFSDQEEMFNTVSERMDAVFATQSDPFEGMTEDEMAEMTPEQLDELFASPPDVDREMLAEIQEYELGVALAAYDCDQDQFQTRLEVQAEYETAFVEENRELVEQARQAFGF